MTDGTGVCKMEVGFVETASRRGEWARGWTIVVVSLLAYVLGATGIFFAFGVFLKPLSSEFHWSREAVSGFTAISGVMYAVASPLIGRLADKFGMKPVILICAVLVALSYSSQGLLTGHLWHYYAVAFLMGPAAAGTSALTFGKVISNWFDRSRGLALSILACGSGLGGVVVPPLAQYLISHYGWRDAYFLLGSSMLTVGTIPVALVLKDAPLSKTKDTTSSAAEIAAVPRASRSQVLRSYTFITLMAASAIVGVSYVGILTHLIPLLTDRGMSAASAAQVLSLLGMAAIVGHLLVGVCFDRFPAARVAAVMLALSGLGVAGIGVSGSRTALVLATMLMGAALGADTDLLPYLVSRYFSLTSYGEFLGYFFAAGTLGAAAGAFLMGRVFDLYHSYAVMTNIIAAGSFVAALLVYLLPRATVNNLD
jgi:predicted MFS family arabinose efflux permease